MGQKKTQRISFIPNKPTYVRLITGCHSSNLSLSALIFCNLLQSLTAINAYGCGPGAIKSPFTALYRLSHADL